MDTLLLILALLLALIGAIGAVLPGLPGTPVSFIALLLLIFCDGNDITTTALIINGILTVVITALDYVAPVWLTKRSGGSKYGTWGTTIGLVIGMFFGLPGILLGPFLGAYIGELIAKTPSDKAFKVATMSFVAFMLTTGIKAAYGIYVLVITFSNGWDILFK
jgi:uncharacterized protein YqgC (DUF456 family)